jgi:alcohol dehydrogenase
MRAVLFDRFREPLRVERVADPVPALDGAVIAVRTTGVCRSDWHGWQGHDADISSLPHVPGHEFVGDIVAVGRDVKRWSPGQRVTIPFVAGCGACDDCREGAPQVCPQQYQPGFTGWGSFAELVAVRFADFNLVELPDAIDDVAGAAFGCRLATAYRAVAQQGAAAVDEWVAVHGCGGVGLSAVMVAAALGALPIAVDVNESALSMAREFGAVHTLNAREVDDIPAAIVDLAGGRGAHLSLDALGSATTAANSLRCLRRRGRHLQVGLLAGSEFQPRLPMELVIARELEVRGSHGIAAADYASLFSLVVAGKLNPARLVRRTITLDETPAALAEMGEFQHPGVTVVRLQ